jgi:hypothetical protein
MIRLVLVPLAAFMLAAHAFNHLPPRDLPRDPPSYGSAAYVQLASMQPRR